MLLGAEGFISGLASNESVSVAYWKLDDEEQKSLRQRSSNFTYMPEIFSYISEEELELMGYVCSCAHCNGILPKSVDDKKKHFLACRQRDIETVFTGDFETNLINLKSLYEEGKKRVMQMIAQRQTTRTRNILLTPINKWLEILDIVAEINNQKQAEDVLAKILDDIDRDDSDSN